MDSIISTIMGIIDKIKSGDFAGILEMITGLIGGIGGGDEGDASNGDQPTA